VETVTARARARLGTLTSQAVYEMLRGFAEAGLVRRFTPPTGAVLFELDTSVHDHAACTSCGRVDNVPRRSRRAPGAWEIHEQIMVGLCPACRAEPAQPQQ
jgi:Fur family ferric uptake transcriptional regulator